MLVWSIIEMQRATAHSVVVPSLIRGRVSSLVSGLSVSPFVGSGCAHFSFGARGAACPLGAVPASQFAKGPSGGQGSGGACRDDRRCRGSRLEGFVAGEYVPAGDQDLAGDGGLGGVAVSLSAADVDVQSVPGVLGSPALLGGLDRRPT